MKFYYFLIVIVTISCGGNRKKEFTETNKPDKSVSETKPMSASNRYHDKSAMKNPPIDCPLRKHGIDIHNMKPFARTEKYIEFLEKKERKKWQKPDNILQKLALKGSERIADVGAGSGYFTFRFGERERF